MEGKVHGRIEVTGRRGRRLSSYWMTLRNFNFNVCHPRCVCELIRGVSVVKQQNLVVKMLYSVSETTCFDQKWPSSGFYTD